MARAIFGWRWTIETELSSAADGGVIHARSGGGVEVGNSGAAGAGGNVVVGIDRPKIWKWKRWGNKREEEFGTQELKKGRTGWTR